jgi:formylglycine-generating enzyme required for sulfatase activity
VVKKGMFPRYPVIISMMLSLALVAGCRKPDPTSTPAPSSATPARPSETALPVTDTPIRATATAIPPTAPPTATALPSPTATPSPTPVPPTATPLPVVYSSVPPANPSLGDVWARPTDGMLMVYVPGGTFPMGADEGDPDAREDELPQHAVTLAGFWIDRTEVTNAQYVAFLNERGNRGEGGRRFLTMGQGYCQIREVDGVYQVGGAAAHPVVMVSWFGAAAYCEWAGGRLPTEAEWEYAARGPAGYTYPWGNDPPTCELARYGDCPRVPMAVASLPDGASWCGALDMAGNVWEWVADWFGRYPAGPQENPTGPSSGHYPVMRGGGWHSPRWELRTTFRLHDTAASSYNG